MFIGFPEMESHGNLNDDMGFIAMELLGNNSLEVLRVVEQQRRCKDKCYGIPLVAVASLGIKLVSYLL